MGALYQGGMEGGWIRGTSSLKAPKVSRRKPLTTSRMVQPSNGSSKEGSASSTQEGGFEPLDLSRRPSPGLGGMEEDGFGSVGEGEGAVSGGGGGGGDGASGVTLSQCLFCPFRTSSAELMAMHLQVNHTSKSRRKRGSSAALDDDGLPKPTQSRIDHSDPDSLAVWRYVSGAESQAPLGEWALPQNQTHNGLTEDVANQLESSPDDQASSFASASVDIRDCLALKDKIEEGDEEPEQEEEVEEDLEAVGENSSLEDSPGQEQDLRMSLALSPALSSDHMDREEEGVLAD